MAEMKRKPDDAVFLESSISTRDEVFAVLRPPLGQAGQALDAVQTSKAKVESNELKA